ncbi:MAG: carboxy terminal-processing peptidase [Porticoccaceae bacterium]|jgi:carboxyl-terminal processing protease|nr:MAG: peptidase S41 [SAR92 bacterium BACL16 MAG-120619-bin48]MDP4655367.1 carboxy terminal-processing peptidase [Alphaproteobacteria bacterium]MDP4745660.1 carboxy terminal-processing peptidase [Porticoccaceae bacterium]MDP4753884.1 carboxy terminal-processing peptidase [Porticoccaceae bacterium]MDP4890483.1 carboxy terminal-processing peptidase [Porticoccaceae bacterium]
MYRVIVILLFTLFGPSSFALDAKDLAPIKAQSEQTALYREILDRLATRHYRGQEINDDLSKRYLAEYIEMLDPLKSYFLQSDIDNFNQWSTKLDDLARRGDVEPGFIMFNRLRDIALAQLKENIALLESDYEFDLTQDETIVIDGDERTWMVTPEERSDYWRKRLKDAMIRLLLNDKEPTKARELLIKRFNTQMTQMAQRDSQDVFQLYVNALAALYDPHTSYFSPRTTDNFQINMSLSLEGIGAELTTEDEYTKISRIIPGGPADLQGILKARDKIISVGQSANDMVDVIGWRLDDVVQLIRGDKDSTVWLEVLSGGSDSTDSSKIVTIVRDKVKLEDKSVQSKIINVQQDGVDLTLGVIEIPAFYMDFEAYRQRDPNYKSTTRDVYKLLMEMRKEKVDGIVLDLRNNGGGSLHEATMLTDLFINPGPVVQIRNAYQQVSRDQRATMPAAYNGPLVVLINRLSASASEIFAGALQDYGRAIIVGSQSFGKGTVQDVTGLSSGQLKLTISKFYRVSGDSTQHRGVLPDIELPSLFDKEEVGESEQENALPWDSIHSVPFKPSGDVKPFISTLTARHLARTAVDPDYVHMVRQLALSESWDADKAISLNIEKRRLRSADWDNQLFLLENDRRKQKKLDAYADVKAWKSANKDSEIDTDSEVDQAIAAAEAAELKKAEDDKNIAETDPMLQETGYILADQIRLMNAAAAATSIVQRSDLQN